jgi:hypothetical protein
MSVYPWSAGFGAKVADPSTLPAGNGWRIAWTPQGDYIVLGHDTTPFVSVYPWTAGFGAKLADPSTLPGDSGFGVAWLPPPTSYVAKALFGSG